MPNQTTIQTDPQRQHHTFEKQSYRYFWALAILLSILFLLTLSPLVTRAVIGDVPQSGLVGHWNFDEATSTVAADTSPNGYNGTLSSGTLWGQGISGDSVLFSASSTNQVTFPTALQNAGFPTSGTLVFWVKGDFSTHMSGRCVIDCYSARNHLYVSTYTNGRLQINLQDAGTNYIGASGQIIAAPTGSYSAFTIPDGVWTHIAIVWDTTNKVEYIYRNGTLVFMSFFGKNAPTWTPSAQVFKLSNSSSGFSGAVDELVLYNRPLPFDEIFAIYNGSTAPAPDTTLPSAPGSLAGNGFSPSKTTLGWSASSDNTAIAGYVVYRDGAPVGYAPPTALAFTDTGLATSTSYTYQVYAFDTSGNRSAASNSIVVSTNAASLLLSTSFEEGSTVNTALIGGWTQYGPNDDAVVVTHELARIGTQAVKFVFNFSDWQNTNTNYYQRAQISQTKPVLMNLGETYWTAFSTYIPQTWQDDLSTNSELIWQFHGSTGGPAASSSPPLALYIDGDTQHISVRGATTTIYTDTAPARVSVSSLPIGQDKGKWIDWVIQARFNYSDGFVKVWKNGVKVADYTGPTIYRMTGQTNENGPWFNIGPYKWGWGSSQTQVSNRTMYADEIKVADNTATCADVTPSGGTVCDAAPPPPPDTTPPDVGTTSPTSGQTISGVVTISAAATDIVGVAKVELYVNGQLNATDTAASFDFSLDTRTLSDGSCALTARAYDAAGNSSLSDPVNVTIRNAQAVTTFPSSCTLASGTLVSGSAADLTSDNNKYLVIRSTASGSTGTTSARFTFSNVQILTPSSITLSVRSRSTLSSTPITLQLFNVTTQSWTTIYSSTVGTSEVARTAMLSTNAHQYIDANRQVLVRVQTSRGGSTTYTISYELVKIIVAP